MNDVIWFCSKCGAHLGLYDYKTHSITEMFTIINGNLVCSGCANIVKLLTDGDHGVRRT